MLHYKYVFMEELNLKIGNVDINGYLALAPMAGVTDKAFRQICIECGANLTYTEMVSAKGLKYQDKKTAKLLELSDNEHPAAAQIFGSDPENIRQTVSLATEIAKADILDINMGCPAPKITSNGDGSALMKNPKLAGECVAAAVGGLRENGIEAPVTVKMRIGWDSDSINAVDFAKICEENGAAALCVHGRTREQQYSGQANWDEIAKVVEAVSVPVIANGDVFEPEDAIRILNHTKAKMCMIGRGVLGSPWIFSRANAALNGSKIPPPPSISERFDIAARQIELTCQQKGEHIGMLEARKHLIWYLKGMRGTSSFKNDFSRLTSRAQMYEIIAHIKQEDERGRWNDWQTMH